MLSVGQRPNVSIGDSIITEGQPLDTIFVVIQGRFVIESGDEQLATFSTRETLGGISLVDSRPPTAVVMAETPGVVLRVRRTAISSRLASDSAFAAWFYKVIATFLTQRLQDDGFIWFR